MTAPLPRRSRAVLRLSGALLLVAACTSATAATPDQLADELDDRIRKAFVDSARATRMIGAQLAVSIPGRPLLTAEYGVDAADRPMTGDVLLGTGSISKMLAAVAALTLVDRGLISLTDTIGRWIPATPTVSPSIPLRALLWHQSGLREYGDIAGYGDSIRADRERSWTPEELLRFVGPPVFETGTKWAASNTDRLVLGMIVSRQTGMPFGEYVHRELFRDVPDAAWTPGESRAPRQRIGTHWVVDGAGNRVDYSALLFGPSLFTSRIETYISASALATFTRRLFDGDLLSEEGKRTLMTVVPDDGRIPGQTGGGVGIRRFQFGGRLMYGNSGGTANSAALVLYDPESKVIVALSTNQDGPSHGNAHFRIVPALMDLVHRP